MYNKLDEDFEYNVVVLGDPKVGKTSLIQSIVNGSVNLGHSLESDQIYSD